MGKRFEVITSEWDGNGTHTVTVRDNESAFTTGKTIRAARDAARRGVSRPDLVRWTRHTRRYIDQETTKTVYVFRVSRLERSYR